MTFMRNVTVNKKAERQTSKKNVNVTSNFFNVTFDVQRQKISWTLKIILNRENARELYLFFSFYPRLRKIFKRISICSKLSDNLFRRTVRTIAAILKSSSTGTLVGIDVLYFMNKVLLWGYLFSISM